MSLPLFPARLRQGILALIVVLCAPWSGVLAASQRGPVEQDLHLGRVVLHRAVCARNPLPGHMHCHAHVVVRADGTPQPGRAATVLAPAAAPSGYGPADLRSAYRFSLTGSATSVIAIVDAYGYPGAEADLATYRSQYGLPPCTVASGCLTVVNQRGGTTAPSFDSGWAQEQALDLDMASALCPQCRLLLVQADDDQGGNLASGVALAVARGAIAISNSYGGTEPDTRALASTYHQPGIAITASAGDSGYGAEFPASAPYVIAVGGTKLVRDTTTARGWRETVWKGTGSGCSAIYPKPAWQTDPLCTKRMLNDVAVVGAPATGVAVYGPLGTGSTSGWMVFGGTSIGAPIIAGIYAAANAHPTGARALWLRQSALNDITQGQNGSCGGTYFCVAQTGYDGPSGNGSPDGKSGF
jgi:hypothetical protein